jgi:hypothetical protein
LKKKQGKEKLGVTRRPGKTRSKTWLQLVDFFFFLLKRRRFDFFLKRIDPGELGQNPEPGPWTGPGLKTMLMTRVASLTY